MAPETKAEPRQRFSMLQSLLGGKKIKQSTLGEPVREPRDDEMSAFPLQTSAVKSFSMPMITTDPLSSHPVTLLESLHGSITDGTSSSGSSVSGLSIIGGDMPVASPAVSATGSENGAAPVWSGRPNRASAGTITGLQALFADPNDIAIFSSPTASSPAVSSPAASSPSVSSPAVSSPMTASPTTASPATPNPAGPVPGSSPSTEATETHKFKGNILRRTRGIRPHSRVFSAQPQNPSPLSSSSNEQTSERSVSAPVATPRVASAPGPTPAPAPVMTPAKTAPRPSSSSGITDPQKGLMLEIPHIPQKSAKRVFRLPHERIRSVSHTPPSPIAEETDLPPRPVTVWGHRAWEDAAPAPAAAAEAAATAMANMPRRAAEAPAWCSALTTMDINSRTPELASPGKMAGESPICLPEIDRGPSLSDIFSGMPVPAAVAAAAMPAPIPPARRHTCPPDVFELEGSSAEEDIYDDDDDDDDDEDVSSLRHSAVSDASSCGLSDLCPTPLDVSLPMTSKSAPMAGFSPLAANTPTTPLCTYTVSPIDGRPYRAFRPPVEDGGKATPRPRDTSKVACEAWVRRSQLFQMSEKAMPMRRHVPEC